MFFLLYDLAHHVLTSSEYHIVITIYLSNQDFYWYYSFFIGNFQRTGEFCRVSICIYDFDLWPCDFDLVDFQGQISK